MRNRTEIINEIDALLVGADWRKEVGRVSRVLEEARWFLAFATEHARPLRPLLPEGWEVVDAKLLKDGDGNRPSWATENFYVLDTRTDERGGGATPREAILDAFPFQTDQDRDRYGPPQLVPWNDPQQ